MMRNPFGKSCLWLTTTAAGVTLAWLATRHYERLGDVTGSILGAMGFTIAVVSGIALLLALLASIGLARLLAGRGVIARWHLSASEWADFRAFDAARAAQHESLVNDLHIRKEAPADGVDVIVGRRQVVVDGSYHTLRPGANPMLRSVRWLTGHAHSDCIEFALAHMVNKYGATRATSLRIPVPVAARVDGQRVFLHYQALTPERVSLADRNPGLVIRVGLIVMLLGGLTAAGGWTMYSGDAEDQTALVLMLVGICTAIGGAVVSGIVALVTRTSK